MWHLEPSRKRTHFWLFLETVVNENGHSIRMMGTSDKLQWLLLVSPVTWLTIPVRVGKLMAVLTGVLVFVCIFVLCCWLMTDVWLYLLLSDNVLCLWYAECCRTLVLLSVLLNVPGNVSNSNCSMLKKKPMLCNCFCFVSCFVLCNVECCWSSCWKTAVNKQRPG